MAAPSLYSVDMENRQILDAIMETADIHSVLVDLGCDPWDNGDWWRCGCPIHKGQDPNFSVSKSKPYAWACFSHHCEDQSPNKPDLFSLVSLAMGIGFGEAVKFLAQRAGLNVDNMGPRRPVAARSGLQDLDNSLWAKKQMAAKPRAIDRDFSQYTEQFADNGCKYFETRGFSADIIKEFRLGTCYDWKHRRETRATIPVPDPQGLAVVNIQGRDINFSPRAQYGKYDWLAYCDSADYVYSLHRVSDAIKSSGYVIILEGVTDFLRLWQYGFRNMVCMFGCRVTKPQAKILLQLCSRWVVMFHGDDAGRHALGMGSGDRRTYSSKSPILSNSYGLAEIYDALTTKGRDPDSMTKDEVRDHIRSSQRIW